MTHRAIISISFAVFLAASIAFYFWASPPKEWASLDYENVNLEELKLSVPGFAGDNSFKDGFGWVDRTLVFENRLRILEGVSPNSPDEKKITLVFIERWIDLPFLELSRLQQKNVYVRDGYNIIGGV